MKIEELGKNLEEAGFYKKEDIKEICEIEKAYLEECEEIWQPSGAVFFVIPESETYLVYRFVTGWYTTR